MFGPVSLSCKKNQTCRKFVVWFAAIVVYSPLLGELVCDHSLARSQFVLAISYYGVS